MLYYLEDFDIGDDGTLLPSILDQFKNSTIVVMIRAEWCGHCKTATPEFIKASNQMNGDSSVVFCIADITGDRPSQKNISNKTKLLDSSFRGFPHVCKFKNGKLGKEFNGPRQSQSFIEYGKN